VERRRVGRPRGGGGGGLARLGFARRGGGCGVDETEGVRRRLYRVAEGPRRAGLGHRAGGGDVVPWLDSGSSPSLARHRGMTRRAGPAWQ
jgi:hypothetical protein